MSLELRHRQLSQRWKDLQRMWVSTQEGWNDDVRRHFERVYWQQVKSVLPDYLSQLEELTRVIQQAKRDVR